MLCARVLTSLRAGVCAGEALRQQLNELDALQQLQGPEGDGRSFLGKELISAMTTLQDRA